MRRTRMAGGCRARGTVFWRCVLQRTPYGNNQTRPVGFKGSSEGDGKGIAFEKVAPARRNHHHIRPLRAGGSMMLFRKCVSGVRTLSLAVAVAGWLPLWQSETARAQVSVGISVNFAPPALPVYEQPLCPGEGYLWTPGYWAWDPDYGDYYWVPGTWVLAPQPGYLWTPPYWGWSGVSFIFHEGYWGPRIGFYGGIDYGYGYPGRGYYGGRWERDRFYYNRSVNNVNVTQVHNVYNQTIVNNVNVTRVSYNGGEGGVREQA